MSDPKLPSKVKFGDAPLAGAAGERRALGTGGSAEGQTERAAGAAGGCRRGAAVVEDTYYDLNIQHFQEKLKGEHGMKLSCTWVQRALQGAGLVAKQGKRGKRPGKAPSKNAPVRVRHERKGCLCL